MIRLYDGMAFLRRRFDTDYLGRGPRKTFTEMLTLPKSEVAVWAFEGAGSLKERRKLFPGYKDRPSSMTDGLHALVNLTRDALKHTRAIQIAVPGREADDVIAHLCEVYAKSQITIHTIDKDLKALETSSIKVECGDLGTIKPHEIRLYKTLVGDPSDKIPGMPGFGIKTFLACDRTMLGYAMQMLVQGAPAAKLFVQARVPEMMAQRMCNPEQAAQLRVFWSIIGFLPMPDDWERFITSGVENAQAGDAVLSKFMH